MKRSDQNGSAHVVLIVLLIVAILGGVGYVGYNALMKKAAAPSSSQQSTANAKTTDSSATRELVFDNWKVASNIPMSSNLYAKPSVNFDGQLYANSYEVYDTDFDRVCPYSWPGNSSIGVINRAKLDDQADTYFADSGQTNREYFTKNPSQSVIYGEYVYYYIKPNGSYECADPSKAGSTAAANALGNARTTFLESLTSIHLTTK